MLALSRTALADSGTITCSGPQTLNVVAGSTTTFPVACIPGNLNDVSVTYSATDSTGPVTDPSFTTTPDVGTGTGTYAAPNGPGSVGTYTYTITASLTGMTTSSYSSTESYPLTVTVTEPAAPSCVTGDYATRLNRSVGVNYSCSGDGLSYTVIKWPKHGGLRGWTTSGATYTPAPKFSGIDHFTVVATDAFGRTTRETVNIDVARTANFSDQFSSAVAESGFSLPAQTTRTLNLSCPSGDVATDGHALVQSVDQGTGTPADVLVDQAQVNPAGNGYSFTLDNPLSGQAQGQLYVNCIAAKTSKGHGLSLEAAPPPSWVQGTTSASAAPGTQLWTATVSCGDSAVVAPGYSATDTAGSPEVALVASHPSNDGTTWTFEFTRSDSSTTITPSAKCLSASTSNKSLLNEYYTSQTTQVQNDDTPAATKLSCPVGSVAAVAGYTVPSGVAFLGATPQSRDESVWFEGLSVANGGTAHSGLLCLGLTTSVSAVGPSTSIWQY